MVGGSLDALTAPDPNGLRCPLDYPATPVARRTLETAINGFATFPVKGRVEGSLASLCARQVKR